MGGEVPAGRSHAREISLRAWRPNETSADPRFKCQGTSLVEQSAKVMDLVKRCDRPGKVLMQLESLILAQSERWRQA